MRKIFAALAIAFAALTVSAAPAFAEKPPIYTAILSRVAVEGYDPVAYFTEGRPVRGSANHRTTYRGFEYRFASAANLAAFTANPARYQPQYGGYCAWAVSQGYTARGNPANWRIVDGRLYLNYNNEIQSRWESDIPGHIGRANANWPSVLSR
jgi:YHS domain-containing protein